MEPRRSFRFLKELSEGAFGKVYLAEMVTGENFKSVVAIKLLHGKWADHEEIAQRSRDEARVLGLLHHRNIIRVEDLSSINGQCAIIMEYLDGVDLKNLVNHTKEQGNIIPRQVIFDVGAQIASALEAAYHHKPLQGGEPLALIHRDIKPSNVMVTRAGEVKVLDFGTAQAVFDHREAKTQALAFGSAAYMAPERLAGDPDNPSGDVFSLGVTLYEMLALQSYGKIHLRPEKYEAKLDKRMEELDLSDLDPQRAEQVLATLRLMLAYDPEARPTTSQVVDLLEALAETIHDGSMRRFCREVVSPLRDQLEPDQDPHDPLTGSTLFEDVSAFNSGATSTGSGGGEGVEIAGSSHTWIGEEHDPGQQSGPRLTPVAEASGATPAGGAAVKLSDSGIRPGPALQMPVGPSFSMDPGRPLVEEAPQQPVVEEAPAPAAFSAHVERSASGVEISVEDEEDPASDAEDPADQEDDPTAMAAPSEARARPAFQLGAAAAPSPALSPADPFAGPQDPSDVVIEPIRPPSRPPPAHAAICAQPAPPEGLDLFTAPTVYHVPRDEDDIYNEYEGGAAEPAPAPAPAPAPPRLLPRPRLPQPSQRPPQHPAPPQPPPGPGLRPPPRRAAGAASRSSAPCSSWRCWAAAALWGQGARGLRGRQAARGQHRQRPCRGRRRPAGPRPHRIGPSRRRARQPGAAGRARRGRHRADPQPHLRRPVDLEWQRRIRACGLGGRHLPHQGHPGEGPRRTRRHRGQGRPALQPHRRRPQGW